VQEQPVDWKRLGLRVGLEVHQQLATKRKLFCSCPTSSEGGEEATFYRRLRPARSELGEVDVAAYFEWRRGRAYVYHSPRSSSCLVEADEEPPHPLDVEALLVALAVAKALHAKPVDEVHVMRKIVIDGSNTTGFQRTALVALDGWIEVDGKRVGIQTICLEEDAARKIEEDAAARVAHYGLERLGIPLIEVSTAPDIESPEEAEKVALKIGQLLRLTGKVKRGIGTIRQDLNVSISGGAKVEVKGVQELRLISRVVANEALRQLRLLQLREELVRRGLREDDVAFEPVDVTHVLEKSKSKLVAKILSREGARALAVKLPKMRGLLGVELQPGKRFGTEVADYARFWGGVAGLIHRDELPGYGITEKELAELMKELGCSEEDSFVLVVDEPSKALEGLRAALERIRQAFRGVPKETRAAEPDGTTRYMRPQPGAARMYPETDVPPIEVTEELLREAEKLAPPMPEKKLEELVRAFGLSKQLAEQVLLDEDFQLIEHLMRKCSGSVEPTLVASLFVGTLKSLKREGVPVENLQQRHFEEVLDLLATGSVGKEALPLLLAELAKQPEESAAELAKKLGLGALSLAELEELVESVLRENAELVRKRGLSSMGFVMGKVMSTVRGKVDGKVVAEVVRRKIEEALKASQ